MFSLPPSGRLAHNTSCASGMRSSDRTHRSRVIENQKQTCISTREFLLSVRKEDYHRIESQNSLGYITEATCGATFCQDIDKYCLNTLGVSVRPDYLLYTDKQE